jgi:hypothetical protein
MTHYDRHYAGDPDADASAIRDICEYLSEEHWNAMIKAAMDPSASPRLLDMMLCMTGVQEFPNHAFIRVFRPDQYEEWFNSLPE